MPPDADAFAFSDVVLVPFPFTNQATSKRRPAIVVSSVVYNARHPDIILMPATSQLRAEALSDDVVIQEWQAAGLLKPSAVKPVIATLEQALVIRRMGTLADDDRAAVAAILRTIVG